MALETISPDALLTQTGLSGSVADVDDPVASPDANWLTAPTNTATVCSVSFPTPTGNPATAGLQTFQARIRKTATNHGRTDTQWRIFLVENGTTLNGGAAIANGTDYLPAGTTISGSWNASLLTNSDGSGVECRIEMDPELGGSPPNRGSGEVGAVEWDVDFTSGLVFQGEINVGVIPASLFSQEHFLAGSVPVSLASSSTFQLERTLGGSANVSLLVGGGFSLDRTLQGQVDVKPTPSAALSLDRTLQGGLGILIEPASLTRLDRALQGQVGVGVLVDGTFSLGAGDITQQGDVNVGIGVNSTFALDRTLAGSVGIGISTLSSFALNRRVSGSIAVPLSVASTMLQEQFFSGSSSVSPRIASSLSLVRTVAGSVGVTLSVQGGFQRSLSLQGQTSVRVVPDGTFTGPGEITPYTFEVRSQVINPAAGSTVISEGAGFELRPLSFQVDENGDVALYYLRISGTFTTSRPIKKLTITTPNGATTHTEQSLPFGVAVPAGGPVFAFLRQSQEP